MAPLNHGQAGAPAATSVSAVCAAVVSCIAAVITVYYSYFKPPTPFEPIVSLGKPVIIREIDEVISIVLSVPITNNGGEAGCVADMALKVESKTARTQWSYFAAWQISLERYLRGMATKEDPSLAVKAPVSPLALTGKGSKNQVILFMPRMASSSKLGPLSLKDLTPGETYVISVFLVQAAPDCVVPHDARYRSHATTEFVLEDHHINSLREGMAVLPLDTSRDKLRERFVRGN